ncbi:hypothetical protein NDU88_003550 [Pleurodeles waltl]|uniref:Uncharacterized protein n=1 Tax=Pleurodeles waltl TaxID=8319 RepID=A0AAV7LNF9_PLEWA|nr:hypothetical protein NDU88_003550 [Pleurodeles waltl]
MEWKASLAAVPLRFGSLPRGREAGAERRLETAGRVGGVKAALSCADGGKLNVISRTPLHVQNKRNGAESLAHGCSSEVHLSTVRVGTRQEPSVGWRWLVVLGERQATLRRRSDFSCGNFLL